MNDNEEKAYKIVGSRLKEIFGMPYIKNNFCHSCRCKGINNGELYYFIGFKTIKDFPKKKSLKGWVVWAEFRVQIDNLKITSEDYMFPQECREKDT